jgi:hypothetical protein
MFQPLLNKSLDKQFLVVQETLRLAGHTQLTLKEVNRKEPKQKSIRNSASTVRPRSKRQ